ncbi:MAG: hypothetical protein AB7I45_13330, partial [Planctomycetota bacterium]
VALSRDRAPPPEDARPSVGRELDADAPGPSLVGVPDEPVAPAIAPDAASASTPVVTRVVPSPLESPEREWRPLLEEAGLSEYVRNTRLLGLADTFSTRRHFDHAAKTLDLLEQRLAPGDALTSRITLARAWNESRRGDFAKALELAEAVSADEHTDPSTRAQGAYASVLFAVGVPDKARARRARHALVEVATPADQQLVADIQRRFGGYLDQDDERQEDR